MRIHSYLSGGRITIEATPEEIGRLIGWFGVLNASPTNVTYEEDEELLLDLKVMLVKLEGHKG